MKKDIWKAAKLLLAQLLKLDIDEQLAREVDYLKAENQVLKNQLTQSGKRLRFTDEQRRLLAVKAKALGKRLTEVVTIVRPETVLRWHKKLVAQKYDSSKVRCKPGRPKTDHEIEQLVLKFVKENKTWGYRRIAGTIKNIGYKVSASAVANIMRRNGFNPSGDRTKGGMSWAEFIKIHKDVIWATDFFTAEEWTPFSLATYYVLFFIQLKTRKVLIAGITTHPNDNWMVQVARNLTSWDGELENAKYLIHDRDTKYSFQFDAIMQTSGIKPLRLPAMSPNLNAFSGHKFYGPKGVGGLYVRSFAPMVRLQPIIHGGGQERGFRSGTANVPGIVGMTEALKIVQAEQKEEKEYLKKTRDSLFFELKKDFPDIKLNGHPKFRLTHNLNVTIPGVESKALMQTLKGKLSFSAGSACSTVKVKPSHVLLAIGRNEQETFQSIRLGLCRNLSHSSEILLELKRTIKQLKN